MSKEKNKQKPNAKKKPQHKPERKKTGKERKRLFRIKHVVPEVN